MFVTTINVEDCNDEPPVFSPTVYAFSLDENTPAGTTLSGSTIGTTDADATADNRAVIYRLTDQGTDSLSWFDVNPSTVSPLSLPQSHFVNCTYLTFG